MFTSLLLSSSPLSPTAPKPMIEFSLMMRYSEHSKVNQIKYLRLLIQEMAAKVDIGFVMSLAGLFASGAEATGMEVCQSTPPSLFSSKMSPQDLFLV